MMFTFWQRSVQICYHALMFVLKVSQLDLIFIIFLCRSRSSTSFNIKIVKDITRPARYVYTINRKYMDSFKVMFQCYFHSTCPVNEISTVILGREGRGHWSTNAAVNLIF